MLVLYDFLKVYHRLIVQFNVIFLSLRNIQTRDLLTFSGGIEMKYWAQMGCPRFYGFCRTLSHHIETSLLICRANQWTGFYMIGASVMKELIFFFTTSLTEVIQLDSEAYSEPSQTSKMKVVANIVNDFQPLSIFTKSAILDV